MKNQSLDKTDLIENYLRAYFLKIVKKYNQDKYWGGHGFTKPSESYQNIQNKLRQFYRHPKFKDFIDEELEKYELSSDIITDKPSKEDVETIRKIDLSKPIMIR